MPDANHKKDEEKFAKPLSCSIYASYEEMKKQFTESNPLASFKDIEVACRIYADLLGI